MIIITLFSLAAAADYFVISPLRFLIFIVYFAFAASFFISRFRWWALRCRRYWFRQPPLSLIRHFRLRFQLLPSSLTYVLFSPPIDAADIFFIYFIDGCRSWHYFLMPPWCRFHYQGADALRLFYAMNAYCFHMPPLITPLLSPCFAFAWFHWYHFLLPPMPDAALLLIIYYWLFIYAYYISFIFTTLFSDCRLYFAMLLSLFSSAYAFSSSFRHAAIFADWLALPHAAIAMRWYIYSLLVYHLCRHDFTPISSMILSIIWCHAMASDFLAFSFLRRCHFLSLMLITILIFSFSSDADCFRCRRRRLRRQAFSPWWLFRCLPRAA